MKLPKNKKILLRVDLNSDFETGKIIESDRIKTHAKTIKQLIKNKNSVVVLAHQESKKKHTTLKSHAGLLNKYVKIKFVNDIIGKKAVKEIKNLKPGKALLLENTRFLKDEFKPSASNKFVKTLRPFFDIYINDAFSVCHRNHTSIVSFPKVMKSMKGPVLEEELRNLNRIKHRLKSALFVLGGVKARDLIPLFGNKILSSGELGSLTLIEKGHNLGMENRRWSSDMNLKKAIKKHEKKITVPIDFAVSLKGKRKEISLSDFPNNYVVCDIGKHTIEIYKKQIGKAKAVVFKGAPGKFEDRRFAMGTRELLIAIKKSRAFSVVAGGSGSDAINELKIGRKGFSYISLSGGALVKYLAGEKLPGLIALK